MSEQAVATEAKIINVPITKGKSTLAVDINAIPDDVFAEVVLQGLKVLLNRGTSKVTKETYPEAEAMKAKAMEVAETQLDAVMTEARRLAKALVKDEIKRKGLKVSHYEASEITKAANLYLESEMGAKLIEKAKANLAEREAIKLGEGIDISAVIHPSEKLIAAAESKKKSGTLSAKQAGKVAKRSKGEAQAAMH